MVMELAAGDAPIAPALVPVTVAEPLLSAEIRVELDLYAGGWDAPVCR